MNLPTEAGATARNFLPGSAEAVVGMQAPADARAFTRAGATIRYWVAGEAGAPVVVLIHGVTLDHGTFAAQISTLRDAGYRVIAWDMRGHGASQPMGDDFSVEIVAEDLRALLAEVGADKAVLVGQSFGGAVAQELCRRDMGLVTALVLVGTPALGDRPPWHHRVFTEVRPLLLQLWPESHLRGVLPGFLSSRRDVQEYVVEATARLSKADFIAVTRAAVEALLRSRPIRELTVPVLATYGDGEAPWLARMIHAWASRDSRVVHSCIGAAGHLANHDSPGAFNEVLLEFVQRHGVMPPPRESGK